MEKEFDSTDGSMGGRAICARCGHDTRRQSVEVTEEDKKEYVRSVLGRRPFSKQYSFLNGALSVTLSDMPLKESFDSDKVLMGAADHPDMRGIPAGMALLAVCIRGLESSVGQTYKWETAPASTEDLLERMRAISEVFPASLAQPLSSAYTMFNSTLAALSEGGLDKNF